MVERAFARCDFLSKLSFFANVATMRLFSPALEEPRCSEFNFFDRSTSSFAAAAAASIPGGGGGGSRCSAWISVESAMISEAAASLVFMLMPRGS